MPYQLVIREEAHREASDAYAYYEQTLPGLGERFLQELMQRYNEMKEHPENYGFIDDQKILRYVKLRHFPYLIVYEINNDKIIVYSIFNGYKNPAKQPLK